MVAEEAIALARTLLERHNLSDWSFRLDNARSRCGSCHFARREITLSKHLVARNERDEVRATLLHEIAHALVGPGCGHGAAWRAAVRRIGGSDRIANTTADMPMARWALQCLSCQRVLARRHRRVLKLANVRCGHCGIHAGMLRWRDGAEDSVEKGTVAAEGVS